MFHVFAGYLEAARKNLDCTTSGLVTSLKVAEKCFATEDSSINITSSNVHEQIVPSDYVTQPEHSILQKFQARIVSELQQLCFVI